MGGKQGQALLLTRLARQWTYSWQQHISSNRTSGQRGESEYSEPNPASWIVQHSPISRYLSHVPIWSEVLAVDLQLAPTRTSDKQLDNDQPEIWLPTNLLRVEMRLNSERRVFGGSDSATENLLVSYVDECGLTFVVCPWQNQGKNESRDANRVQYQERNPRKRKRGERIEEYGNRRESGCPKVLPAVRGCGHKHNGTQTNGE